MYKHCYSSDKLEISFIILLDLTHVYDEANRVKVAMTFAVQCYMLI